MSKTLEAALVKPGHRKQSWTEKHILEIAKCSDPVTGPAYFMDNFFFIQHPVRGRLKYSPYDFQKGLLDSYNNNRFSVNLLSRQTGKTTTAAGFLLWYAMFMPDSTILIAAHKYTGAQEIMQRIRYAYENCPDHIRAGAVSYNKGSIDFDNGSRIISQTTTETTGRGLSISLLYCDEFAFVRPTIAKEFWTSMRPTLATGGRCIITSTPNSDEDQFALIWKEANKCIDEYGNDTPVGRNGFKAFKATWREHPERDDKWASEERSAIGDERFRREHECEFLIFDETLINAITLAELAHLEPVFKQGQIRWFKKPQKNKSYVVALDPSLGTGGDYAAIQVLELPDLYQVAEWQHNKTRIQDQVKILREITQYIYEEINTDSDIYYTVENNTLGEAALVAIHEVGEENIRGSFISEPHKAGNIRRFRKGFNTTNKSKLAACAKLKQLLENRRMILCSKPLISQFKTYVALGGGFEAKTGEHDDLIAALLVALRAVQALQTYDPHLDSKLRDLETDIIAPMPFIVLR